MLTSCRQCACRRHGTAALTGFSAPSQIRSLRADLAHEHAEKENILAEATYANRSLESEGLELARDCDRLRAELAEVVTSDVHGAFERVCLQREVRRPLELVNDLD